MKYRVLIKGRDDNGSTFSAEAIVEATDCVDAMIKGSDAVKQTGNSANWRISSEPVKDDDHID